MSERYEVFVGIDWGEQSHQVSVSDKKGDLLGERSVPHRGDALVELSDWLLTFADGDVERIAVALEVPRGPIVDTLLERGYHVFAINPKQLDRFRDRYSVGGAKDDRRDARVLGSAIRTDPKAFRVLTIDDPLTIQLREYSRHDVELGEDFQRAANRASFSPDLRTTRALLWLGVTGLLFGSAAYCRRRAMAYLRQEPSRWDMFREWRLLNPARYDEQGRVFVRWQIVASVLLPVWWLGGGAALLFSK